MQIDEVDEHDIRLLIADQQILIARLQKTIARLTAPKPLTVKKAKDA